MESNTWLDYELCIVVLIVLLLVILLVFFKIFPANLILQQKIKIS